MSYSRTRRNFCTFIISCAVLGAPFASRFTVAYSESAVEVPADSSKVKLPLQQEKLPKPGSRVDLLWQGEAMVRGYVLIQNVMVVDASKSDKGATVTLALNKRNKKLIDNTSDQGIFTTLPHMGIVADQRKFHLSLLNAAQPTGSVAPGDVVNIGWTTNRTSQKVTVLAKGALVLGGPEPAQLLVTYKQKKAIDENKALGKFQIEHYNKSGGGLFKVGGSENKVEVNDGSGSSVELVFDKEGQLVNRRSQGQ